MAALTDADRVEIWAEVMRDVSAGSEPCGVLKAELRAAVDAADVWANSNAGAYNSALPQPARTILTPGQKARLLMYVVRQRWLKGA